MRGYQSIRAATRSRSRAAALAALALVAAVPVALGADASGERLRAQDERLERTAQAVTLELYGLESQLARARAEAAALAAEQAAVQAERDQAQRRLAIAVRAAQLSQERLQELVRELYAQDVLDPLAIVLGAGSLEEALTSLENLDRSAAQTMRIGRQATEARQRLARLSARLAARTAELRAVGERARARAAALEERAAERAAYLAAVRHDAFLTKRQLAQAEARARAAQRASAAVQAAASAPAAAPTSQAAPSAPAAADAAAEAAPEPVEAGRGARTMRVTAVAYILRGRTASGLPTGPGIVAVDPAVIPLGTRFYVPGYGEAVAADTGSAIRGAMIDVWLPTLAQARAWGRRSVVITFR